MSKPVITLAQLQEHNSLESLYVLVHGKVHDVTKFVEEHPGGDEVLLAEAGKDATEAFEDVGHSDEARALLPGLEIGEFEGGVDFKKIQKESSANVSAHAVESASTISYFIPLSLLAAYFAWRFYYSG